MTGMWRVIPSPCRCTEGYLCSSWFHTWCRSREKLSFWTKQLVALNINATWSRRHYSPVQDIYFVPWAYHSLGFTRLCLVCFVLFWLYIYGFTCCIYEDILQSWSTGTRDGSCVPTESSASVSQTSNGTSWIYYGTHFCNPNSDSNMHSNYILKGTRITDWTDWIISLNRWVSLLIDAMIPVMRGGALSQ